MSAIDLNSQVLDGERCQNCAHEGLRTIATHESVMPWGTVYRLCDRHEKARAAKAPLWKSAEITGLLAELRGQS